MTSQEVSQLPTRQLGRTSATVTELGLGTAPLGDLWDVIEEDEAGALLNAAWDGGVRYFDTSPWYGKGQAEHRVGRALYRKPRDRIRHLQQGRPPVAPSLQGRAVRTRRMARRPRVRCGVRLQL